MFDFKKIALIKITDYLFRGARNYLENNDYTNVDSVCNSIVNITGSCENFKSTFELDYFGQRAFLNQSAQLTIEPFTQTFKKIYCIVKSFRKEKADSSDNRRLIEFPLLELEVQGDLQYLIKEVTNVIRCMINSVLDNCSDELKLFRNDAEILRDLSIGQISYRDAILLINDLFPDLKFGDDLQAEHELAIYNRVGPCFAVAYPLFLKFWNMRQNDTDPTVVNSADLILKAEAGGMSERETDFHKLCEKLINHDMYKMLKDGGVEDKDFDKYLNFHLENPQTNALLAFKTAPELLTSKKDLKLHSGVGIGVNRLLAFLLNVDDIKETCVNPRTPFTLD